MLVVGYRDNPDYDVGYHTGYGKIKNNVIQVFGNKADIYVQADGHELEKIRNQFNNIPMSTNRVISWTGETAWFIINNIYLGAIH